MVQCNPNGDTRETSADESATVSLTNFFHFADLCLISNVPAGVPTFLGPELVLSGIELQYWFVCSIQYAEKVAGIAIQLVWFGLVCSVSFVDKVTGIAIQLVWFGLFHQFCRKSGCMADLAIQLVKVDPFEKSS